MNEESIENAISLVCQSVVNMAVNSAEDYLDQFTRNYPTSRREKVSESFLQLELSVTAQDVAKQLHAEYYGLSNYHEKLFLNMANRITRKLVIDSLGGMVSSTDVPKDIPASISDEFTILFTDYKKMHEERERIEYELRESKIVPFGRKKK